MRSAGLGSRVSVASLWRLVMLAALGGLLGSCGVPVGEVGTEPPPSAIAVESPTVPVEPTPPVATPDSAPTEAHETPAAEGTAMPPVGDEPLAPTTVARRCVVGIGLRRDTAALVTARQGSLGMVMCATVGLAEECFPGLEVPLRVLGAPSLAALRSKAESAALRGVPYEALAYGLENSVGTPDAEARDPLESARQARALADEYGKLLVMGPGFRLMEEHAELYPQMAALADVWVLQTQRLQEYPAGDEYRAQVARVIEQIRTGNPGIAVWAQITLPPDREPDADAWLTYHEAIADLVEGRTYIGNYAWSSGEDEAVTDVMARILDLACTME